MPVEEPLVAVPAPPKSGAALLVPLAVGGAVALLLGAYGSLHEPSSITIGLAGFSSLKAAKVWLGSLALVLILLQLISALAMWGKLPGVSAPTWTAAFHRWTGRIAFLVTLPVAIHCLFAFGLQMSDTRVLEHSLLGCLFYGAFTTKMLLLPRKGLPGWALPVVGGAVFALLVGLWLSSSLWFFTQFGVTF